VASRHLHYTYNKMAISLYYSFTRNLFHSNSIVLSRTVTYVRLIVLWLDNFNIKLIKYPLAQVNTFISEHELNFTNL
jgi:hypothetical protein